MVCRIEREVHNIGTTMRDNFGAILQAINQQNQHTHSSTNTVARCLTLDAHPPPPQHPAIPSVQVHATAQSHNPEGGGDENLLNSGGVQMPNAGSSLMKTINFDGIEVTFDVTTVQSPPAVSFADDIAKLAREWYSSSILTIAGHGIPIRHWDKVYKKKARIKNGAWASFRSTWNNWGVSRQAFCHFWFQHFSPSCSSLSPSSSHLHPKPSFGQSISGLMVSAFATSRSW